jgi:hypothetical protein
MHQFCAPAGSPFCKIALFEQNNPVSPCRGIYRDTQTCGTPSDNQYVALKILSGYRVQILIPIHLC